MAPLSLRDLAWSELPCRVRDSVDLDGSQMLVNFPRSAKVKEKDSASSFSIDLRAPSLCLKPRRFTTKRFDTFRRHSLTASSSTRHPCSAHGCGATPPSKDLPTGEPSSTTSPKPIALASNLTAPIQQLTVQWPTPTPSSRRRAILRRVRVSMEWTAVTTALIESLPKHLLLEERPSFP
ncbi:hypothetical protein BC829DRAFT_448477 [Chytridium lagenaria]|nr:hypothetical protein BC829DRAFT_448477 [Chytridium lagenaria]